MNPFWKLVPKVCCCAWPEGNHTVLASIMSLHSAIAEVVEEQTDCRIKGVLLPGLPVLAVLLGHC